MNRIRLLRLLKGIKQAELASEILVSQSSLSGYESGKFEPDSKTLLKIADFFKVSVDYLLGRDSPCTSEEQWSRKIPVYKHIQSNLIEKLPAIFYYQEINPCASAPGEYFGLLINEDCMEPRICSGDLVIARRQKDIPSGSLAVVQVGTDEAVVKNFISW